MANPQVENGHLKIANELVEALARTRISGEDNQVLWAVIRKTYGWQLKEDLINLDWIVKLTGLRKSHSCRSMARLVVRNIVTKSGNGKETKYGLQKDYEKWESSLPNLVTTTRNIVTKSGNQPKPAPDKGKQKKKGIFVTKSGNEETVTKIGNSSLPDLVMPGDVFMSSKDPKDTFKDTKEFAPSEKKHPLVAAIDFDFVTRKWKGVTEQDLGDWQVAYPACNIELQLAKAAMWLLSNPEKRKKKYRRFITGWLTRSQEKGGK